MLRPNRTEWRSAPPFVRLWGLGPIQSPRTSLTPLASRASDYTAAALNDRIHELLADGSPQAIGSSSKISRLGQGRRQMVDLRKPQGMQPLLQGLWLEACNPGFSVGRGQCRIERVGLQ